MTRFESIELAVAAFRAAAEAKGDPVKPSSARKDHEYHARMAEAVAALDEFGPPGTLALEELARDTSPRVRQWAAAELLSRGDLSVVPIVEELATQAGMAGFGAQMLLKEHRKGALGSPFGPRAR